jgi:hypothetical protein
MEATAADGARKGQPAMGFEVLTRRSWGAALHEFRSGVREEFPHWHRKRGGFDEGYSSLFAETLFVAPLRNPFYSLRSGFHRQNVTA